MAQQVTAANATALPDRQGDLGQASQLFDASLAELAKSPKKGVAAEKARVSKEYATYARSMIRDLEVLEVWIDDFESSAGGQVDGWEEIELFGIDVLSKEAQVVMSGRQRKPADAETGIRLLRVYRSSDMERVSVRVRIDQGRVSPILRLGGPQGTRTSLAALEVFRDLDGKVKFRARDSRGQWFEPRISEEDDTPSGALSADDLVYTGGVPWPQDGEFHTFEIRRSRRKGRSAKTNSFDVYFGEQPVALNVQVGGLSTSYEFGVYARTDAIDNDYSVTVDDFKIFRINKRARRSK